MLNEKGRKAVEEAFAQIMAEQKINGPMPKIMDAKEFFHGNTVQLFDIYVVMPKEWDKSRAHKKQLKVASAFEVSPLSKHETDEDQPISMDQMGEAYGVECIEEDERTFWYELTDPSFFDLTATDKFNYTKEHTIPIQAKWLKGNKHIYLPIKYEYYDMIASGEKTVECREYKLTWVKRLLGARPTRVTFQRGYGKNAPKMDLAIKGFEIIDYDGRRYGADEHPDISAPEYILIDLGKRIS